MGFEIEVRCLCFLFYVGGLDFGCFEGLEVVFGFFFVIFVGVILVLI